MLKKPTFNDFSQPIHNNSLVNHIIRVLTEEDSLLNMYY